MEAQERLAQAYAIDHVQLAMLLDGTRGAYLLNVT